MERTVIAMQTSRGLPIWRASALLIVGLAFLASIADAYHLQHDTPTNPIQEDPKFRVIRILLGKSDLTGQLCFFGQKELLFRLDGLRRQRPDLFVGEGGRNIHYGPVRLESTNPLYVSLGISSHVGVVFYYEKPGKTYLESIQDGVVLDYTNFVSDWTGVYQEWKWKDWAGSDGKLDVITQPHYEKKYWNSFEPVYPDPPIPPVPDFPNKALEQVKEGDVCRLPVFAKSTPLVGQGAAPKDPNEKVGSRGRTEPQYISGGGPLRYSIYFENQATATAPAQEVVITDQLEASKMDLTTFSFGPISFGDRQVNPPPGLKQFSTDVDLRPGKNLIVRIAAGLDATGRVSWYFGSIDPATGKLTEDPLGGFLPPNATPPQGEGSVVFTVMPKKDLPTGTEIRNKARIVFDLNDPVDTPEWLNTLDNTKPSSQVLPLAATQTSSNFTVQWAGTDEHSGILDYTVFVSEDGGPFTPFLINTTATSGDFTGKPGRTYAFYSIARDQTGNLEDRPPQPDAVTQVLGDTIPPTTMAMASPPPNTNGWNRTNVSVTLTATDNPDGSGVKEIRFTLSGAQAGEGVAIGSGVLVPVSAEGVTTLTYFSVDHAGNQEATNTLTVQIDKTPPAIAVVAPSDIAYTLNQAVAASYTCDDFGSGVASCTGPVPSGSPIDTASVGAKTFAVNASDNASNASSQSVNYAVAYNICLLYDPTKAAQSGSTIPVKLQVCDVNGTNVSSSNLVVTALGVSLVSTNITGPVQDSGNANPDNNFRFDLTLGGTGGYIYNLSTKGLGTGTYNLSFKAGADPTTHTARFQVK